MSDQLEIAVPESFRPLTIRIRDGWQRSGERRTTREHGRHYARTTLCPHCFRPFTSKGFWRHARACKK